LTFARCVIFLVSTLHFTVLQLVKVCCATLGYTFCLIATILCSCTPGTANHKGESCVYSMSVNFRNSTQSFIPALCGGRKRSLFCFLRRRVQRASLTSAPSDCSTPRSTGTGRSTWTAIPSTTRCRAKWKFCRHCSTPARIGPSQGWTS
jgi:hypothetical protein